MSVDKDELLKEIERCEYEKPRLVVWTQMDEFRLQVMNDLVAANKKIEQLERVAEEMETMLESETHIGGDWRTRRDAALANYAKWTGM